MSGRTVLLEYLSLADVGECPDYLDLMQRNGETQRYVPERTAKRIGVGNSEYGHYECSGCGSTVLSRDCHCWKCGARLE